ncbi:MAG: hypothetical protein [Microviridae sp.]|nr:MAG: hypothetical protein [Microviridae sp.]
MGLSQEVLRVTLPPCKRVIQPLGQLTTSRLIVIARSDHPQRARQRLQEPLFGVPLGYPLPNRRSLRLKLPGRPPEASSLLPRQYGSPPEHRRLRTRPIRVHRRSAAACDGSGLSPSSRRFRRCA